MNDLIRCTWCRTELAPEDAAPIEHARLRDLPDAENMQCKDHEACDLRQDALDAAVIVLDCGRVPKSLSVKATPGVLAAMQDGERLREAIAIAKAGL